METKDKNGVTAKELLFLIGLLFLVMNVFVLNIFILMKLYELLFY